MASYNIYFQLRIFNSHTRCFKCWVSCKANPTNPSTAQNTCSRPRGVYFVPKLYNCPIAQQGRDEKFYNCPQFAQCVQCNIFKFARFVPFVQSNLENWANFVIILSKSVKIIAKSLKFWINFSQIMWIFVIFSYFCPLTTKNSLFLPPP